MLTKASIMRLDFPIFVKMENYVLFRKKVEMQKNKDYFFNIPSSFNVKETELFFEVPEGQFKKAVLIELILKSTQTGKLNDELVRVPRLMGTEGMKFTLRDEELLIGENYLLIGCKASQAGKVELSIKRD